MKRRKYLRLVGAVGLSGAIAGCTELVLPDDPDPETPTDPGTTTTEPGPSTDSTDTSTTTSDQETTTDERLDGYADRFETVIDVVDDANFDSTGQEPCDSRLRNAAGDDTLLYFPSGTYLVDSVSIQEVQNFGMLGGEDAVLKAPRGRNGGWLTVDHSQALLFEDLDIDATARNCTPALKLGVSDGLEVRDVAVKREDLYADERPTGEVGNAFMPTVRSSSGTGVVERFEAEDGGYLGTYNDGTGRVGIFIGQDHKGTIELRDCRIEQFPNNGVYASRTRGKVRVEGGVFRNNDISQVRLGSEGSYVADATIEVDADAVRERSPDASFLKPRGIRVESGSVPTAGVAVRNCEVNVASGNASGIEIGKNGGRFRIEDTSVRIDADTVAAVMAKPPTGGAHPTPPEPHGGTIRNVEVTGDATGGAAIRLYDRPDTTVVDTAISQRGEYRDGYLIQSTGCRIEGGSVVTGGYPLTVPTYLSDTVSSTASESGERCVLELRNVDDVRTTSSGTTADSDSSIAFEDATTTESDGTAEGEESCVTLSDLSDVRDSNGSILTILGVESDGYRMAIVAEEDVDGA